ncbi:TRAP transporter small permease subunit [Oceanobacillus senegalensis]|uniref:TRAP transporter small permease subunit n=1 Tax=Oceanobacillus senegalensis TaxID=1936063 RepID=UPI000A312AD1|nr:TRAP transporter small permease subunit [Oceanobacillus senegalensis]
MKTTIRIINKINESMMWVVGAIVLIMGILLTYSVVMRYFFNNPPVWSFDLTGWFTGIAAFLGGGYALLYGAHVRVDIFYEKFPLKIQSVINIFSSIFVFLIVIVFIWKGMEQVINNYQTGAIASTGLSIYLWIKWVMMPIGGILLGLQAIANLIKDIYRIIKGEELIERKEIA